MRHPFISLTALAARLTPLPLKQAVYRSPGISRLIRRGLNRYAPSGLSEVCVAAGALAGMRLRLDMQSEKDYWLGTYETDLQSAIMEFVEPGMVAYDVGANIGYISLQLGRAVGESGHVYAFEALPANIDRLRANILLNGMDSSVTVVPRAVSDTSNPESFLVGPSGGTGKTARSAGRKELSYSEVLNVPSVSLDTYIFNEGNPPPQVVKMDIEGGEVIALPGMRRVLKEARPLVLLELHGPEAARISWDELITTGYRIYRMTPGYDEVPTFEALDWKAYLVAQPR